MKIKTMQLILFIILISIYSLFSTDTTLIELKKSGVSPGYSKEHIDVSVNIDNTIFVGTHPNGHIYKIDDYRNDDLQFKDLGIVGSVLRNKYIMTLIALNNTIYGGSSVTPYIFKLENALSANPKIKIISDGTVGRSTLEAQGIQWLYDATYIELNNKQYIYFGTWNNQGKVKIVEMNINSELVNVKELDVDATHLKHLAYSGPFTYAGQSTRKPWLIIGTEKAEIILLNLNNARDYLIVPISEICLNNFSSLTATTDYPGIIWAYNGKGQIVRYDLENNTINFKSDESYGAEPVYHNNYLYTQGHYTRGSRIHANYPRPPVTRNIRRLNSGRLEGTQLMVDEVNNNIVGVSGIGLERRTCSFTRMTFNDSVTIKPIREPDNKIDPSGGGEPVSLEAYGGRIFLSLDYNHTETVFDPARDSWINRPIYFNPDKVCVQADALLVFGDYLYYGQYSRPYIRRRSLISEDITSDDFDLKPVINAASQVRITDMISLAEKNELLLGTGWSVPPTSIADGLNERAVLLKVTFPFNPDSIFNISHLDDYRRITDLTASSDNNYIYGIAIDEGSEKYAYTRHGVFIAPYENLTDPSNAIYVLDFGECAVSDILTQEVGSEEYLYLSIDNTIRRYSTPLPIVNSQLKDSLNYVLKALPQSWRISNLEKSDWDQRIYFTCDTRLFSMDMDLNVNFCGEVKSSTNKDRNIIKKITQDPLTGNIFIASAEGKIFRHKVIGD